jgi:hypothetical protein
MYVCVPICYMLDSCISKRMDLLNGKPDLHMDDVYRYYLVESVISLVMC